MTRSEVIDLLKSHSNEKGIAKWNTKYIHKDSLKSYGIGLTVLRKLAKQIGRNHTLALELWNSDVYDVKIMALLIDEPKQVTREQAEQQVEDLKYGHLAHVFSACDATLSKTPFVYDLLSDWVVSDDKNRRSCAYGLLYEVSKFKKKNVPDNTFFLKHIERINQTYFNESFAVKCSMGGALLGLGKRNAILNAAALEVATKIGPIPMGSKDDNCEPFNVVKHLTSPYIKNKLGL